VQQTPTEVAEDDAKCGQPDPLCRVPAGIELLVVVDSYGQRCDEESGGVDVAGVETQK